MRARTLLYKMNGTKVLAGVNMTLAALTVLFVISCTSHSTIEEIREIDINGKDPLTFTNVAVESSAQQSSQTKSGVFTKASSQTMLSSGFMVSAYKSFKNANQQTVMSGYNVEYKVTGSAWDGSVRPYWDYTGVEGQYEKYWDYSNYPYRFHAVAPYPQNASDVTLTDNTLKINKTYYYQTCLNGGIFTNGSLTTEGAEPYMIAQVQRDANGTDHDLMIKAGTDNRINTSSTTLNRDVWMPFHHINSKIRFAVYSTSLWATANMLYIKNLKIKIASDNFVTSANGYEVNSTDTWRNETGNSYFDILNKVNASALTTPLFQFDGGRDVSGNDLRECQGHSSAFFMQCPDGLMQLPQENVQMTVSLDLYRENDELYKRFTDIPISIELPDNTLQPLHNWLSGYIHTYYLVLNDIDEKLELTFTATLTPWEDVSGSLSTDLEK